MKTLAKHLEDYLAVRYQFGFKLRGVQRELERFVRYIRRENASFITTEVTRRWITGATDSRRWRSYLVYMVRGFARYLSAVDPRTEIQIGRASCRERV